MLSLLCRTVLYDGLVAGKKSTGTLRLADGSGHMLQKSVSFYTKPGCSLCEKAMQRINKVRFEIPFHLEVIDITRSPELMQEHGLHIPVVFIEDVEVFRHHVNETRFRELLAGIPANIKEQ